MVKAPSPNYWTAKEFSKHAGSFKQYHDKNRPFLLCFGGLRETNGNSADKTGFVVDLAHDALSLYAHGWLIYECVYEEHVPKQELKHPQYLISTYKGYGSYLTFLFSRHPERVYIQFEEYLFSLLRYLLMNKEFLSSYCS